MMAADSDGTDCYSITTVVTCEGDLADPTFPCQLEWVITNLQTLLGGKLYIRKLEPWNSVRVTLSIPREAAIRLRHLAAEGAQQLRALGILSIQVEGDQVISLRLAGPEPQEIILRTTQDGNSASPSGEAVLAHIIGESQLSSGSAPTTPDKIQFRSPNVVCPTDTVVPKVPSQNVASTSALTSSRPYTGPFPFTSMNQAIHSSRDSVTLGINNYNSTPQAPPSLPPPPYPGKNPPITISSPLLVNLLQNDGVSVKTSKAEPEQSTLTTTTASPTIVSSTSVFKYSAVSLCAQDNAFYRKTVTTKPNSVLPAAVSQTIVQHLSAELSSSHPNSVLPLTSLINQCNSTKAISKSPPLNHVLAHSNPVTTLAMTPTNYQTSCITSPSNAAHTSVGNFLQKSTRITSQVQPTLAFTNANLPFTITTSAISISSAARQTSTKPNESLSIPNSVKSNLLSVASSNILTDSSKSIKRNIMTFPSIATSPSAYSSPSRFEPISQLLDLTSSLTELKSTDLEQILPSIESDLTRSPPSLPEELTNSSDHCSYLINPLTGELEPHINSDIEDGEPPDIFTGLPLSPNITSDEDTNSTCRPDTTDQSDSESRSNHSDSSKNSRFKNARNRERGRDSPNLKPTEKIKLRLKLEKSEPIINPAYKVDVSYIAVSANKKPSNAVVATSEELRVPPLHISLKGRNHVVINNRKKFKNSSEENTAKLKVHKAQDSWKYKKSFTESVDQSIIGDDTINSLINISSSPEQRRIKKIKTQDHREQSLMTDGHLLDNDLTKYPFTLYPKERRGSDSELAHSIKRYEDTNGIFPGDKKRRLSHTEQIDVDSQPHLFILGSTNTGTVTALPTQKPRKEKMKLKECPKIKELNRNKNFAKTFSDKLLLKQLVLPTGDMDMEAKFKQRLLEDGEKGVPRPPHRTENLPDLDIGNCSKEIELVTTLIDPLTVKDKPPELVSKIITTENKNDLREKHGRSPNSGGQGEDSGIESMDALSEKSPNQASQSPHTDISESLKSKPQVPSILDIEAQLAKMEGLNGEDMNDNKHNVNTTLEQCCSLTSVLQDSLKQGPVSLNLPSPVREPLPQLEVNLVALKPAIMSEKDLEPMPVRVSPPLYTYSNPDKHRDSESPTLLDYDINSCSLLIKNNNLLEQLLIHIPDNQNPSSPNHMTRSLRSRASSKLSSPELNSPVPSKQTRVPLSKCKRRESDSSINSLEDLRNRRPRKMSEHAIELTKACVGVDVSKLNTKKGKIVDDSSDSDEPLIEVAGKVRKNNMSVTRTKFKAGLFPPGTQKIAVPVKTRSSVRTIPALNTRSKGDRLQRSSNALRRKTRSSVSEGEGKRRKAEVK